MSRPILHPHTGIALPPRLCAPVAHYVEAWSCGRSAQRWDTPFDKRAKGTHRLTIADTHGPIDLTVPIVKPPTHRCAWSEIAVSTHGEWWDTHRETLASAYGRTPYFEFYIDRFLPMLTPGVAGRYPLLSSLAAAWDREIRSCLGLEAADPSAASCPLADTSGPALPPYRQVRQDRLGFIPGLSILDLIFNLGPEAQIYLNRCAEAKKS